MSYSVRCWEPALKVKLCEGGWQLPEVLQSDEPCEDTLSPPITGVEVYCEDSGISGTDLPMLGTP